MKSGILRTILCDPFCNLEIMAGLFGRLRDGETYPAGTVVATHPSAQLRTKWFFKLTQPGQWVPLSVSGQPLGLLIGIENGCCYLLNVRARARIRFRAVEPLVFAQVQQ